jgi:hypothetical protein
MARTRVAKLLTALAIGLLLVTLASGGVLGQGSGATADPTAGPAATSEIAPPTPEAAIDTGDPRSDGQGPGLVGEPLLVLLGVVLVGVATVVVTAVIARATGRA